MHPCYVPIDAETLKRLYLDQRLTTVEIATRLGCGESTIGRRLRQFRIQARPRGPAPACLRRDEAPVPLAWSPQIAYAVGLITTDGNLSTRTGRLTLVSKDVEQLETLRHCLRLTRPITPHRGGFGTVCHKVAWSDRALYAWLLGIGLTPAKSLTLGPLAVPDEHFADFLRGCIDGDGSILRYVDRYHVAKNESYVYERLYVSLVSASRRFLEWMQATSRKLIGVNGSINVKTKPHSRPVYVLRYAKRESMLVLRFMYYAADVPCLARKRATAEQFLSFGFKRAPDNRATETLSST